MEFTPPSRSTGEGQGLRFVASIRSKKLAYALLIGICLVIVISLISIAAG